MNRNAIRPLVQAVNLWLSFQDLCGRSRLFSEAYLSQPIGEFLLSNYRGKFEPETNHPTLRHTGRGRPNQIDYALFSPEQETMVTAVECKWITSRAYPKQLLVDDILRLECVRVPGRHVTRFFLVAGNASSFNTHFVNLRFNSGGQRHDFTTQLLSFDEQHPEKSVSAFNGDLLKDYYLTFEKNYSEQVPKTFLTHLVSCSSIGDVAVYLWEIQSVRNRRLFSPKTKWTD
jgi:hypothetical protein